MNLQEAIDASVQRNGDKTALKQHRGRSVSYNQLLEQIKSISSGLEKKGVSTGDKVAFSSPNTVESLCLVLSNWHSGRTNVHVNPNLEAGEFNYYIEDSGADAFVFHHSIADKVEKFHERYDIEMIQIGGKTRGWATSLEELKHEPENIEVEDDYLASITYTSGTTGLPKGVPFRSNRILHAATILNYETEEWRNGIGALRDEAEERIRNGKKRTEDLPDDAVDGMIEQAPRENDTHCLIYPTYHISGSNPLMASIMAGATIVLPERRKPDEILDVFRDEEVSLIGGVPAQLKDLAEHPEIENVDTSHLRHVHTAGGLLTSDVMQKVNDKLSDNLCHEYASSETCEISYSLDNSGSVGRPTILQDVRLIEPGSGNPDKTVEEGKRGEIIVDQDGPTVFNGYWEKPEKTEKKLKNGWYFTGDIARRDSKGALRFEGRVDDMIVSGGENISPGDVENVLLSHPEINEAGVIGVEDDRWGQKVVGFVETSNFDPDSFDSYLKQSDLADFKRPKKYFEIEEMPKKETSGVDRKKLQEIYLN